MSGTIYLIRQTDKVYKSGNAAVVTQILGFADSKTKADSIIKTLTSSKIGYGDAYPKYDVVPVCRFGGL